MSNEDTDENERLLDLIHAAIAHDKELREKYQVGDKFRFISDRLNALLSHVEENIQALRKKSEVKVDTLSEDEVLVYIYLYNAQGLVLQTWQKMLGPGVFYEYSVNRPIYAEKSEIEAIVRAKTNKNQHGYITIAINKSDILPPPPGTGPPKDSLGNPLIKVREGSLHFDKMVSFTHNNIDYKLVDNQIVKK
jgi:hypothetical protein